MSRFAELSDGRRLEFPDGTTDDVIQATVRRELGIATGEQPQVTPRQLTEAMGFGPLLRGAEGAVLGLQQAGAGAQQLFEGVPAVIPSLLDTEEERVAREAATSERQAELTRGISERDVRIEELGTAGLVGSVVGEAAPSVLLPGGLPGGILKRLGTGIAADIAASVADPVREDETRASNLQRAATFSAIFRVPTGAVGAAISPVINRIANSRAGNVRSEDARKLIETADAEDIRIFFDDISQSPLAKKASVAAEIFDFLGTGAGRRAQNKDIAAAADRWLQRVSGDSDDFAEVVQSGVKRKLDIFRREASRKYDRVARELGDAALAPVPTERFTRLSTQGIAAETSKGTRANPAVIDFLTRFRDAPRGNFDEMIEFRSDLNKEFADFISADTALAKSSINAITRAKDALNADMSAFAKSNGAEGAWRAANEFYANTVVQFKKGKLKSLLNPRNAANFDEQAAWKYLTQNSTNPQRARLMWQSLDAKGRAGVRAGLITEAVEVASGETGIFSPAKFASYLENKAPVVDQFFRGAAGEELKGLQKVMRHVERAGQFAENPPTGQRLIPLALLGGVPFAPGSVATLAGTSLAIKGMFQTKAGRDFLLAANKATPASERFNEIVEIFNKVGARASN